jgi:hypothetical protein
MKDRLYLKTWYLEVNNHGSYDRDVIFGIITVVYKVLA